MENGKRYIDNLSARRFGFGISEKIYSLLCARNGLKMLVMNLGEVRFIDSSGLGMLIGCYKIMHGRQGKMIICDANDNVYRILELSGMKKLMSVMRMEPQRTVRGEGNGKR